MFPGSLIGCTVGRKIRTTTCLAEIGTKYSSDFKEDQRGEYLGHGGRRVVRQFMGAMLDSRKKYNGNGGIYFTCRL